MNYKAIFIDIDGTLVPLDNKAHISPGEMLNFFSKKGLRAAFVTGRGLYYVQFLLKEFQALLNNYFILYDGALIINPHTNHVLFSNPIEAHTVQKLLQRFESIKSKIYINKKDAIYSEHNSLSEGSSLFPFWKPFSDAENTFQIYIRDVPEEQKQFVEEILDEAHVEYYSFPSARNGASYMVSQNGVNKASAIEVFLEKNQIREEETIVVGDGINDLPMFNLKAYKIAAYDALDEVKKKADLVLKREETLKDVFADLYEI